MYKPRVAHWSPFDFSSLGPSVPSFNTSANNGLVLNYDKKREDMRNQQKYIWQIEDYLQWIEKESNTTSLDATTRSRVDILNNLDQI